MAKRTDKSDFLVRRIERDFEPGPIMLVPSVLGDGRYITG
jgi:hypothetical protein